ncbi:MAG: endo-1,4-beta-xylanase [Bacteroidales bacterium]|nr:endo-1,4-beta-xylanase [Bacteroidales bacterium]
MVSTKSWMAAAMMLLSLAAAGQDYSATKQVQENDNWRAEANARIEQHRKEDVSIRLTQNGKPVNNATVRVEMTRHEFLFGSNVFAYGTNEEYNRRFAELLNFATMGFYWAGYEREKDKPNYAGTQPVAEWCAANGIIGKGHPLIWNTGEPSWIKDMTEEEILRRQMARTTDCVARFKNTITVWDVVNEMVGWDRENYWGYAPRLTSLVVNNTGKVPFCKAAFAAARKGNPNATLLINDWMVYSDRLKDDRRYSDLLSRLTDEKGQPIYDAIGIQSHMHGGPWINKKIWDVCEEFAKFGKPLHFTEVTILSTTVQRDWGSLTEDEPSTPEGEAFQRDALERFYTMVFSHPATAAITWWDFSDRNAWRHAPAGLLHKDMTPKPAYEALKKLIKNDWATNTTVKTDKTGTAKLRAFRGDYRITVTQGKKTRVFTEKVAKGKGVIEIEL